MTKRRREAAPIIVRPRADARFRIERRAAERALERLVNAEAGGDAPRVLLVAAHPDDEAIGAGALLQDLPDATIVHVTDGAPRDPRAARRRGFATREEYARTRRAEVIAALQLVGIQESQVRSLGFVDGDASFRLVELCHQVVDIVIAEAPDIVLTHPYEGGHTDHDATAFAVHLACGILRREGLDAPVVIEFTSYHNRNGRRVRGAFLPHADSIEKALELPVERRRLKERMFRRFESQQECLKAFPVSVERFRMAPRYVFTIPPHAGQLDYERYCSLICGDDWRSRAQEALDALRTKRGWRGGLVEESS